MSRPRHLLRVPTHRAFKHAAAFGVAASMLLGIGAQSAFAADPELDWDPSRTAKRAPAHDEPRGGGPSIQAFPGLAGRIAYSRAPFTGDVEPARIFTMNSNGSDQRGETSTTRGYGDEFAAWSPGGTLIAFARDMTASTTDDVSDLFIMDADGSNLEQLTATAATEHSPAWSPDGHRIAFASNRGGQFNIYTMDADGGDVQRLTSSAVGDFDPAWSPDGTKIAFTSYRDGNAEIYTINATGGGLHRLTNSGHSDLTPAWRSDGQMIAFTSSRGPGDFLDIFTMNANGSNVAIFGNFPTSNEFTPAWNPSDPEAMVYTTDYFGDLDIAHQQGAGADATLLTVTLDDEFNPDWQPLPEFPLVDARFSNFEEHIVWAFNNAIASGCTAELYCPTDPVTRGQMATFLDRALDLPGTTEDFFTDDDGSTHEIAINRVAAAGIASGCTATTYCPTSPVTREQMASFLDRAFDLAGTSEDFFTDDEASTHEIAINRIAAAGIASGCTATTYCPKSVVTRGQMAAFLHRALEP